MPSWPQTAGGKQISAVTVTTNSETGVLTTGNVNTQGTQQVVTLDFEGEITTGTSTTAIVLKCYRGSVIGGTQVGATYTVTVPTAGNKMAFAYQVLDTPGEVSGQQYTFSITQTGGAANGTVDQASCAITVQ